MSKQRESISNFDFRFMGRGHYAVMYTSPKTGRSWRTVVNDMQLIDATKNEPEPTQASLNELKRTIKRDN